MVKRTFKRSFGGRFWSNPQGRWGICVLLLLLLVFLVAPSLLSGDPLAIDYGAKLKSPSASHLAGTDQFGRDQLVRFLHGGRISILMAAAALGLSVSFGIFIGVVAAYAGGLTGSLLMRTVDLLLSMPSLVVVLTLVGVLGIGTLALVAAVAASIWPNFARMAHGLTRQALVRPDVLTARMMGITGIPLVIGHVLPGVFGEVLGLAAFYYAEVLGIVAGLSFVGLGIQPPSPEWGSMLSESQPYFSVAPWLVYMPVSGIVLLTIVTVTVASAIRSAISPIYKAPSNANFIQHAALGGRS